MTNIALEAIALSSGKNCKGYFSTNKCGLGVRFSKLEYSNNNSRNTIFLVEKSFEKLHNISTKPEHNKTDQRDAKKVIMKQEIWFTIAYVQH